MWIKHTTATLKRSKKCCQGPRSLHRNTTDHRVGKLKTLSCFSNGCSERFRKRSSDLSHLVLVLLGNEDTAELPPDLVETPKAFTHCRRIDRRQHFPNVEHWDRIISQLASTAVLARGSCQRSAPVLSPIGMQMRCDTILMGLSFRSCGSFWVTVRLWRRLRRNQLARHVRARNHLDAKGPWLQSEGKYSIQCFSRPFATSVPKLV